MSDLKERLRAVPAVAFEHAGQIGTEDPAICHEAADRIAELESQLAQAAEAERAALVKWLRSGPRISIGPDGYFSHEDACALETLREAADAIEARQHLL